jgi:hypothetical protein
MDENLPSNRLDMDKDLEIIEGKKLIAEFLGWYKFPNKSANYMVPILYPKYNTDDEGNSGVTEEYIANCPFDTSYDWLIPVIRKFNDLTGPISESIRYLIYCDKLDFEILMYNNDLTYIFNQLVFNIKWYNKWIKK